MIHKERSGKLLAAMINSDRVGASALIDQAHADGISSLDVIAHILDPAIVELGRLWEEDAMSLAQNYVAAKICEDALLRCIPENKGDVRSKGAAVIGNIEDDFHSLGRKAVGLFLSAAGWDVYDLGNDVTAEEFLEKALEVNACVIGCSAMMQTTALNILKLRHLIDERGLADKIKLVVGGAVFNWRPEMVAEVGADGTAHNAVGADQLFSRLQFEVLGKTTS